MHSSVALRCLRYLMPLFVSVTARGALGQEADATLQRVQRLVHAGDRNSAWALADSALASAPPGSDEHANALFARALASSNAADAERDYLRVSIEYPLSPRAEDALMAVAQLRLARGDRNGARRQFERMVREHPTGAQVATASYWAGRLALEAGDTSRGCPSLATAREHLSAGDVELSNQIDYYAVRCRGVPSAAMSADSLAVADSAPPTKPPDVPPVAKPPAPTGRTQSPAPRTSARGVPVTPPDSANPQDTANTVVPNGKQFTVQVAAFPKRRDADALAEVLEQRGFQVRVFGGAPYRVRVGRYDSRASAAAALERMKASRLKGIIVEAEPR